MMKHFLGDAVMATPMIDGLLGLRRGVCVATTPTVSRMLEAPFRPVEHIALKRTSKGISDTFRLARSLRRGRFDVAILVNRSFRSALTVRLAGIKVRAGHAIEGRTFLLTHSVPYDWEKSESDCYLELARLVGFDVQAVEPKLVADKTERAAGKDLLKGAVVGIQPGASTHWKRIPLPVLAAMIDGWHEAGYATALLGGPEEGEAGETLAAAAQAPTVNLIGATDIRTLMGVLANLRMVIGGDTGLMHVAAAVGCPTVTAFGSRPPSSKWGHLYPPHKVLDAPGGKVENMTFECLAAATELTVARS
jgi:ADP-heptose:LPS heptosyltransferase